MMPRHQNPTVGGNSLVALALIASSTFCSAEEISAFVEPYRDIDVASPEMGTLAFVQVKEGDHVTAGQVVAGLDELVLRAALEMARTAMDARGRLGSAEAEYRLQSNRLQKIIGLHQRQHASEEEVARAQAQEEIAAARVQAVCDDLEVKFAEYQRIKAQLEQKRIKSPINGIVTRVYKDAGEFVSATEPDVVKVVQLDPLLVVLSVPAQAARSLRVDQQIPLVIGVRRQKVKAGIEFVSPTADAQSGTVRVRVRIPNADGRFQSGDPCWFEMNTPSSNVADKGTITNAIRRYTRRTTLRKPPKRRDLASED